MFVKLLVGAALALSPTVAVDAPAPAAPELLASAQVAPAAAPVGPDVLAPGATLAFNQSVRSRDGHYTLLQQSDGNLVFYRDFNSPAQKAIWDSQTLHKGVKVIMQKDGNLVELDGANKPIWNSGTAPNPGASLLVQNDGNAVIYSTAAKALWANGRRA